MGGVETDKARIVNAALDSIDDAALSRIAVEVRNAMADKFGELRVIRTFVVADPEFAQKFAKQTFLALRKEIAQRLIHGVQK